MNPRQKYSPSSSSTTLISSKKLFDSKDGEYMSREIENLWKNPFDHKLNRPRIQSMDTNAHTTSHKLLLHSNAERNTQSARDPPKNQVRFFK